jgi:aminoglycoside phosphotransferase (APT) family kinase protein
LGDNTVFVVDEVWAFRFPRRQIAVENLRREAAVLPHLVGLPLPIPEPMYAGRPSKSFRWPFLGVRFIPGVEPAEATIISEPQRVALGRQLGRFLGELHEPGRLAGLATGLPRDPMGRADMMIRVPRARDTLDALERLGLWRAPASADTWLARASTLEQPEARAVAHGDLHHRHLLVNDEGGATGVIDRGDVCRADPSVDLPLYWSLLTPAGREAFLDAYARPISDDQLLRARVLALNLCAILAAYARDQGPAALERESVAGLDRVVIDQGAARDGAPWRCRWMPVDDR